MDIVDFGIIYVDNKAISEHNELINIAINNRWAKRIKIKAELNKQQRMQVDDILDRYRHDTFQAKKITKDWITVKGKIYAYSPVSRD